MRHLYVVSYDVCDPKRLRGVFKTLRGYGDPLQLSVFRCELDAQELVELRSLLRKILHHGEDQVLFVNVGPVDGRASAAITSLGQPYTHPDRLVIVVWDCAEIPSLLREPQHGAEDDLCVVPRAPAELGLRQLQVELRGGCAVDLDDRPVLEPREKGAVEHVAVPSTGRHLEVRHHVGRRVLVDDLPERAPRNLLLHGSLGFGGLDLRLVNVAVLRDVGEEPAFLGRGRRQGLHLGVMTVTALAAVRLLVPDVNDQDALSAPVSFADHDRVLSRSSRMLCDGGDTTLAFVVVGTIHAEESVTRQRRPSLRPRTPSISASMPPSGVRTARRSRDFRSAAAVSTTVVKFFLRREFQRPCERIGRD